MSPKDIFEKYIRLLDIDTREKKITAKMYSSYYHKTLADDSHFVFGNIKFVK